MDPSIHPSTKVIHQSYPSTQFFKFLTLHPSPYEAGASSTSNSLRGTLPRILLMNAFKMAAPVSSMRGLRMSRTTPGLALKNAAAEAAVKEDYIKILL